jgi:hypothetical protein
MEMLDLPTQGSVRRAGGFVQTAWWETLDFGSVTRAKLK